MAAMGPLERVGLGFTTRTAERQQLVEPYLDGVQVRWRAYVIRLVVQTLSDSAVAREARYATAARRLAALGQSRAAISRTIGTSTAVMDRAERENRRDATLKPTEPILTNLVPELHP